MTKTTRTGVYGWSNAQGSNISGAESVVEWKCKGGIDCRAEREGGTWKLVRGPVGVRGSTARNLSILRKAANEAGVSDQQRRLVMLREEGYIVFQYGTVYLAPGRLGPAWTVMAHGGRTVQGLRSLEYALACAEEDVLGHNL